MAASWTVVIGLGLFVWPFLQKSNANEKKQQVHAKKVIAEDVKTLREGQRSQARINKLSDQTQTLFQKYRRTLQQIERTKIYNDQLRQIIANQENEKTSITEQIATLKETNKGIVPLMVAMVKNIEEFVKLDIPFLPKERDKRITELKNLLTRADISTSEKFRRILEAYQVENEYGRTIETYRGIRREKDKEMTVDYLRIGRIALIYQRLDGKEAALWNPQSRAWEKLPGSYKKSIQNGLKMAGKQRAPQLVKLPIFAPGETL